MVMVKPALPYLDVIRAVRETRRAAGRRLQRQRRVRDDQGRRRAGPGGRARAVLETLTGIRRAGADIVITYHAKDAAAMAQVARSKVRSTPDGAANPARRRRPARCSTSCRAGFAARAAAVRPGRRARRMPEAEVLARVRRLMDKRIIREITPIFDTRALGYSLDARRREGRRRSTRTARRRSSTATRASPTTTCATTSSTSGSRSPSSPDSKLGLQGTLDVLPGAHGRRVDPPAADAEAVQDPHGPRDGGGHRGALDGRRRRPSRWSSSRSSSPTRTSRRSRRRRARCRRRPSPTRRPPSGSASPRTRCCARLESLRERGGLRRVAAILFHRRAGFSANGMGVWKVPRRRGLELRAADGRLPRHLALLPAADLPGLAVLRVHDGPRPLEGGVRRDPRLDRRGDRHQRARDALLEHRVQEGPDALLHRGRSAAGRRSTRRGDHLRHRHPVGGALPPRR